MRVYLGLGTNLGDKESNLHVAVRKINERIGEVTACCVESVLPPLDILRETQEIERELGRMKKSAGGNYSDRLIDIDILLYGDLILHTPELEIPHPLMTERRFVMDPLAEIASDVVHPVLGKRLGEL